MHAAKESILFLLPRFCVVESMSPDEPEAHNNSYYGRSAGDDQSELMKGEASNQLLLRSN